MGNGPCLLICAPIVLSYVGGASQNDGSSPGWKSGLQLVIVFSLARLFACSLLGFFSVIFYRFVFDIIAGKGAYLQQALGVLIVLTGIAYFIDTSRGLLPPNPLCGFLRAKMAKNTGRGAVLFGLLIGFSPCAPHLAVLTFIAATAKDPLWGLLGGFFFGLGTTITPLIPLGAMTGLLTDKAKMSPGALMAARVISSAVLIYFGVRLIRTF